jgi:ribosomal protein S18 acetylase RimI-like enzyme
MITHKKDLTIRTALLSELSTVLSIVKKATRDMENRNIHQWDDLYPDSATLLRDIERGEMQLLIAEGTVLGFITLNTEESPEYSSVQWQYDGPALIVHRLTIDPVWQGKGFAKELMKHAEHHAREAECQSVRLDAYAENVGAIALYLKLEYQKAGRVTFRKGLFNCYEKAVIPAIAKST